MLALQLACAALSALSLILPPCASSCCNRLGPSRALAMGSFVGCLALTVAWAATDSPAVGAAAAAFCMLGAAASIACLVSPPSGCRAGTGGLAPLRWALAAAALLASVAALAFPGRLGCPQSVILLARSGGLDEASIPDPEALLAELGLPPAPGGREGAARAIGRWYGGGRY